MCFAQGHNAVMPVMLEPATPQSQVKDIIRGLLYDPPVGFQELQVYEKYLIFFMIEYYFQNPSQEIKKLILENLYKVANTFRGLRVIFQYFSRQI